MRHEVDILDPKIHYVIYNIVLEECTVEDCLEYLGKCLEFIRREKVDTKNLEFVRFDNALGKMFERSGYTAAIFRERRS